KRAPATIRFEGLADAAAANPFRLPRNHPGIGSSHGAPIFMFGALCSSRIVAWTPSGTEARMPRDACRRAEHTSTRTGFPVSRTLHPRLVRAQSCHISFSACFFRAPQQDSGHATAAQHESICDQGPIAYLVSRMDRAMRLKLPHVS